MSVRRATTAIAMAACLMMSGCAWFRRAPPPPPPVVVRYTVGPGYRAGGVWHYPKDSLRYDATGLAAVADTHAALVTDGERFDPTAMAAGHQTLPLPCLVRVTNLETGREVVVRVNDRGPATPHRVIELTPRAAELLGVPRGGTARVRLQVMEGESRRLAESLGGGSQITTQAAPRVAVQAESLPPPPGARGRASAPTARPVQAEAPPPAPAVPDRLPETVTMTAPRPGQLILRAADFGRADYANSLRAKLSGLDARVEHVHEGRGDVYRVLAGPYATVAQADVALDQALRAGVGDARIVVE